MHIAYRQHRGSAEDYQAVVDIGRAIRSDDSTSVGDLRDRDQRHGAAGRVNGRWLAEADDHVVGSGEFGQLPWLDPDVMYAHAMVRPEHQGAGVGRGLLERIEASADAGGASRLFGHVDERHPEALRVLEANGWAEIDRWWESSLDLTSFDPAAWEGAVASVAEQGVALRSVASFCDERDGWQHELHRIYSALERDVPTAQEIRMTPFEDFVAMTLGRRMLADGFLVAFADGEMIGLVEPMSSEGMPEVIHQNLTGVVASHRRMGIATALKAASAAWAKSTGYLSIRTSNAQSNAGMLAVNDKLGFVRGPAVIEVAKQLVAGRS